MSRRVLKFLCVALIVVLIGSVVAGCASEQSGGTNNNAGSQDEAGKSTDNGTGKEASEPITITFTTQPFASPQNVPKIAEYIKQFEEQNNIKVEVTVAVTDDKYRIKLLQDVAANNVSDVAFIDGSWLPEFDKMDALVPLDKWFTSDKQQKYFDFAIKGSTLGGQIKALWFHTGLWSLYYRKDLLQEAGYSEPPKDWNELLEMGKKLSVDKNGDGVIDTYALGIPGSKDVVTACTLLPWFWGHAGAQLSDGQKVVFGEDKNKEAMVDMLEFLRKLVDEKIVSPDMASLKFTDVEANFIGGACAMAILGSWHYASIKENGGEDFIKNVAIAPIPAVPGNDPVTTAGGWTIAMFTKDPAKQDAAWKFMEFFAGHDVQKALTVKAAQMTTLKEIYDEPELKDDAVMQAFKEGLFGGKTRDAVPFYSAMDEQFQNLIQIAVTSKDDLGQAVERAAAEAQKIADSMK